MGTVIPVPMATGFSAYLNADYMSEQFQEIAIKIGD